MRRSRLLMLVETFDSRMEPDLDVMVETRSATRSTRLLLLPSGLWMLSMCSRCTDAAVMMTVGVRVG